MSGLWLSGAVLSGTFVVWGLVLLLPSFPLEKAGRWGRARKERAEVLPSKCRVLFSVFVLAFLVVIRMLSIFAARETRDAAGLVLDPVVVALFAPKIHDLEKRFLLSNLSTILHDRVHNNSKLSKAY